MASLAFFALVQWWERGLIFYLLLVFKHLIFAAHVVSRKPVIIQGGPGTCLLAYLSAVLPFLYAGSYETPSAPNAMAVNMLSLAGFLLAALAVVELGDSLGVSPAVRGGRVRSGVYGFFPHPMYLGYAIAESGWILVNFGNLPLWVLSASLYCFRARYEGRLFECFQTKQAKRNLRWRQSCS